MQQTVRTGPAFVELLRTWSSSCQGGSAGDCTDQRIFTAPQRLRSLSTCRVAWRTDTSALPSNFCLQLWRCLMISRSISMAIVMLGMSSTAFAQTCTCPAGTGSRLNHTQIGNVLSGNTVCVGSSPTWQAQEQHLASGALNDYKRGAGHPTDPTAQVGTWSVSGTGGGALVLYNYGGTQYSYGFCSTNTTPAANQAVGFCPAGPNPGTATSATLRIGAGAC